MEPAPAATRAKLAGVLKHGVGIAMLAGVVLLLVKEPTGVVVGASSFGSWFEPMHLPFGLRVIDSTHTPRGEEQVRLADPSAPSEEPPSAARPSADERSVDPSKLAPGPEGQPPIEVLVVCYPMAIAYEELETLFPTSAVARERNAALGRAPDAQLPMSNGRMLLDRGQLPWGNLSASYVYERELEPGNNFVDTMRVNLTTPDRPCVLFARWRRGSPASKQRLAEVLAALQPRL